ncbi:MAG TPA: invasin domain 3-containing protein, partial [Longimicrobium sp.]
MRHSAFRLAAALMFLVAAAAPSAAQQRAPLRGDVNGDGRVSAADAQAVLAHLRGRSLPAGFDVAGRGDADGDGRITRADAELITRFASGQNVAQLPVGRPAESPVPAGVTVVECRGNPATRALVCSTSGVGGTPDLLYGGQGRFTTLTSSGIAVYADTFAFDVTVKNLIPQAIGTTNGTDPDPNGVRVFFADGVQNTSATAGSIEVANPDGVASFTASGQPFFRYSEIIPTGATSAAKRWKLRFDPGVETFAFRLYLSSPVQFPDGWVDVAPDSLALATGESALITDTVRNAYGMVLDTAVTWTTSAPAVATVDTAGRVTAVGDGVATITATSGPRVGRVSVVVSTAAATTSRLTATPPTLAVYDTSIVTLTVLNGAGEPVTRGGATVTFATTLGTLGAVTDNGNGTYTAPLTATSVGVARVSATLAGQTVSDTVDVTFTAGAPASYAVTSSTLTPVAGDTVTITAGLRDAYGNPVTGVARTVTWSSTNGGSFSAPTSPVDSAGNATVRFATATVAGTAHFVTATDSAGTTGNVTVTTQAGAAAIITIQAGDGQTAQAGTTVPVQPAARVTDANGNIVVGAPVVWSIVSGGGEISGPATVNTDSAGISTLGGWKLGTTAGTNQLAATIAGDSAVFTATGVAGMASPAGTEITSARDTIATREVTRITVTARDAAGNPLTTGGATITLSTTLGTLGTVTDAGNGTYTADLTHTGANGTATVTGTLNGAPITDNAVVIFIPREVARYAVTVDTVARVAGQAITVTARALDADSFPVAVAGRTITWSSTGGGAFASPTSVTDSAGVATAQFTSGTTAGTTYTVTATDSEGKTGTSAPFTTVAGAPATLAVNDGNGQSAPAGSPVATPPSVRVTDAGGNPVPGVAVTFAVAHGGGSVTGATQTTDSLGIARVGSWTLGGTAGAGSDSLRASVTGLADVVFSASATAAAPAVITRATADSVTATVGSAVTPPPAVTITDAFGNPVAGVTVIFTADSTSGTVTGDTTTTDSLGVATVGSWTLRNTPGINTLTATAGSLTTTFTATGTVGAPTPITTRITVADSTLAPDSSTV